jgi:hypothetical protein
MSKRTRLSNRATSTSFEQIISDIIESTPKKKQRINLKTTQDVINFNTTFKPIDTKKIELIMKSPNRKVELSLSRNVETLADIFFSMLTEEFLDKLIEYNSNTSNLKYLPSIFSKFESTRTYPDIQQSKRNFVIAFYATKLYIQHKPALNLRDNFKSGKSIEVPGFEQYLMSYDIFEKMNSNFLIPIALVKELNNILSSLVKTGRIVVLDEKQKDCSKSYTFGGHARWAKKKTGHWITESAVLGPTTELPILNLLMPLTKVKERDVEDEPYNNVPNSELVKEAYKFMEKDSILLTDGYYPDMNVRRY